MTRYAFAVVAVGAVAGLGLGADLKSGPQPGQGLPVFNVLSVNGRTAGQKACQI